VADIGEDKAFDIREARKLWASKEEAGDSPGKKGKKAQARKNKRKQLTGVVDRRSLQATGRTEQFNFRANPDIIEKVKDAASAAGIPIAEWMEEAMNAYLAKTRGEGNA
jgi:hypothetical protein